MTSQLINGQDRIGIFHSRDTDSEVEGWTRVPILPPDKTFINVLNEKNYNYVFDVLYWGGKLYERKITFEGIESFEEYDTQDWYYGHWQFADNSI